MSGLVLYLLLLSTSAQQAEARACTSGSDCLFGDSCVSGTCVTTCTSASDCFGDSCVSGKCVTNCTSRSDCLFSEGCVAGTCADACTTDLECETTSGDQDYTCDTTGNAGNGLCTYRYCTTTDQCKAWYDGFNDGVSNSKCIDNECTFLTGCECDQKCRDDYYGKIVVGSIIGAVIAVVFIVVVSIPTCCGKDFDQPMFPKIAGCLAIVVGILVIFIPMIASTGAADGATKDVCDACDTGCTDADEKNIRDTLGALGVIVAYTLAFGWMTCVLGIVASAMGCCTVFPCCGPLAEKKMAAQQMPPHAGAVTVVGQAVLAQPKSGLTE